MLFSPKSSRALVVLSLVVGGISCRETPEGQVGSLSSGPDGASGSGGSPGAGTRCDTYAACTSMDPGATMGLARPVEPPATGEPPTTGVRTFAIKAMHLGDEDVDPETPSYRDLGFDLDGVNSTPAWGYHCKSPKHVQDDVRQDGTQGIDNMFSKKIVTTFAGDGGDSIARLSDGIQHGEFSVVFRIAGLGDGANYTSLLATLYGVRGPTDENAVAAPVMDFSTYAWDILDTESEGTVFPASYMNDHVWVSGAPQDVPLILSIYHAKMALPLRHGVIQARFDASNTSATGGIISGAIMITEMLSSMSLFAKEFAHCEFVTYQEQVDDFARYADLYVDENGSILLDPTKECNAISVGIGFEAVPSMLQNLQDGPELSSCD